MLHATEVLGAETYDSFGNFVGRVKEMFVVPAEQPNRISRLMLERGKYRPLVARYDQVESVAPGRVRLTTDESALELYHPNEAWLAVRKDLLDQQIIDTNGRKVVRVNDVDLVDQRVNGNTEMRITQVDVGLPAAVRRWALRPMRDDAKEHFAVLQEVSGGADAVVVGDLVERDLELPRQIGKGQADEGIWRLRHPEIDQAEPVHAAHAAQDPRIGYRAREQLRDHA